jgi:S-adenosylmethionine-diacylglycerol 3-amino-3-carboxypropyl transferase
MKAMSWGRKSALHYSCVWEDADVLCHALEPVAQGRRLLSISSAGDNSLALLTLDPCEVVAIDIDPLQLAALDLRSRAFETLDHAGVLAFLGVHEGCDRLAVYQRLRPALAEPSRVFWDSTPKAVHGGIIHFGRFERYIRLFRAIFPRRARAAFGRLAEVSTVAERARIYDEECDGFFWRVVTSVGFSPKAISTFDYHRRYFDDVTVSVVRAMRARLRHALTAAPWTTSPYLTYFLTGNYSPGALPLYLRPQYHGTISSRIHRLSLRRLDVADAASLGRFSGFNLSNIFEYVGPAAFDTTYQGLLAASEDEARLAYWCTFSHQTPRSVSSRVRSLAVAARLHERDRVGSYESFHIDEVCGEIYSQNFAGLMNTMSTKRVAD